ncbi:peptidase associated/transthyretin-like domain-containing protein [Nonomuraea cypriaca]|nr:hypothetical protein [Nonomuraea cypriaca]
MITGLSLGLGTLLGASSASAGVRTGGSAALFAGARACRLTPAAAKGPYYFDSDKIRSDIREGKPGVRLRLAFRVQESETCRPLPAAVVEIWQCDAAGIYSGAEAASIKATAGGPPSGDPGPDPEDWADMKPADTTRYLRGAQVTNGAGAVEFTTIWPGWYPGRTVHVHVMVHFSDKRVLSTQLMFDEALNAKVLARPPYSGHPGRDTLNSGDSDYRDDMLVKVVEDGDGYLGTIVLAADADRDGG